MRTSELEDRRTDDRAEVSDVALVEATRAGDAGAFGELWRRHYPSALAAARATTATFDPEDLAQEAFAAIYNAIQRGGGPTSGFRAYLLTSVRNTAAAWGRSKREIADDELDSRIDPKWDEGQTEAELDQSTTAAAFRSLPTRWQEVLWYTEVEQMKPAAVAPLLGMKPVAVAQLAFRAREGLREAWIQAHLRTLSEESECAWVVEHLGSYARKNSARREATRIDAHLADCARCTIVAEEADHVSGRLALVLLPLTLGAVGAGGYLASLQSAPVSGAVAMVQGAAAPSSAGSAAVVGGSAGAAASITGATAVGAKIALSAAVTAAIAIASVVSVGMFSQSAPSPAAASERVVEVTDPLAFAGDREPATERSAQPEAAVPPPVEEQSPAPAQPSHPTSEQTAAPGPAPAPAPAPSIVPEPVAEPEPVVEQQAAAAAQAADPVPTEMPYVGGSSYQVLPDGQTVIDVVVPVADGLVLEIGLAGEEPQTLAPDASGLVVATLHPTAAQLHEGTNVVMAFANEFGSGPALSIPVTNFAV